MKAPNFVLAIGVICVKVKMVKMNWRIAIFTHYNINIKIFNIIVHCLPNSKNNFDQNDLDTDDTLNLLFEKKMQEKEKIIG